MARWKVHRWVPQGDWGPQEWCVHVEPRDKPNWRFGSYTEAFAFAFAQATIENLNRTVAGSP